MASTIAPTLLDMLSSPIPQIAVVNESTQVNQRWCWNLAWVLGYQVRWQAGPLLKIAAEFLAIEPGKPVPIGASVLHLVDTLPEAPEALGFHDETEAEVPYGRVGIVTALDNNAQPAEVCSHEALELLKDPHVNLTAFDPVKGRLYPYEECDPVQGGAYDLGAPYGRTTGWIVSDFILDSWADPNTAPDTPTSFRGTVKGPFALGKAGYLSYATSLPPSWQQELGELADKRMVDADDRVRRRLATAA